MEQLTLRLVSLFSRLTPLPTVPAWGRQSLSWLPNHPAVCTPNPGPHATIGPEPLLINWCRGQSPGPNLTLWVPLGRSFSVSEPQSYHL